MINGCVTGLVLFTNFMEEIEAVTPVDILVRAGAGPVTASITGSYRVTGRSGLLISADRMLDELKDDTFDYLLLPGGPGHKSLRESPLVQETVKRHAAAGKVIAAICAAPVILKDAGLLAGKRYTAHYSVKGELPDLLEGEDVVVDGALVTSRGAGTALPFALTLVEKLCGRDKAVEVARSICYTGSWATSSAV